MPAKKSLANRALGEAIRSARESGGHTQEGFARKAGMDRSYYGAIERGEFNLSVDTVLKIAAALEMTACELFGRAKL
jgi:transcriptional regulator with XRE-family HTH domain